MNSFRLLAPAEIASVSAWIKRGESLSRAYASQKLSDDIRRSLNFTKRRGCSMRSRNSGPPVLGADQRPMSFYTGPNILQQPEKIHHLRRILLWETEPYLANTKLQAPGPACWKPGSFSRVAASSPASTSPGRCTLYGWRKRSTRATCHCQRALQTSTMPRSHGAAAAWNRIKLTF